MENAVEDMPDFKVKGGYSAETSGGILTMMKPQKAKDFVAEIEQAYGQKAWIIGEVVTGSRQAKITSDAEVIPVKEPIILG